ncbi:unnamed protein product [Closterium sp. Yama58-4]|nr:unnamed protein product [Closterium sp. Yama58-4]
MRLSSHAATPLPTALRVSSSSPGLGAISPSFLLYFNVQDLLFFIPPTASMASPLYSMDHAMADDAPAADGEEFLLDETTEEIHLSELETSNLPAAKKACVNMSNDTSSGPSAAGSASPSRAAACSYPAPPEQQISPLAGSAAGPILLATPGMQAPPRALRRPRLAQAGPALLPRRRRVVVTLLLPEAGADANRVDILLRLGAMLKGHMFSSGTIPSYDATSGEVLRVPRRSYARLLFSWPSADDAVSFRNLFPLTLKLANSRSVLLKVYEDPNAGFTAAKAAGATTLSIRNVPTGYEPEDIKSYTLAATTDDGLPWLNDLQHLHRVKDPYEGVVYTILDGIPIPSADDPNFQRIPAAIFLEEGGPPMLLNFSSHVCLFCANNHRDADHASFAAHRRQRITNRHVISVAQLQQTNGQILGSHAAPTAIRNDPGLLLIGLDSEMETWTCVLCEFQCGHALDSAMAHIASPTHSARLRATAHLPAAKDKYSTWRAMTLLETPPSASPSNDSLPTSDNASLKPWTTYANCGRTCISRDASFWQHISRTHLTSSLIAHLAAPISLHKVGKAISQLARGKTPGADGLPGKLYKHYNPRFAPAFHALFNPTVPLTSLPPSMLRGRTVLIPKKGDSSRPDNLRPITLMNADYRILALCLANRLQKALPRMIHPSQTAFIQHRKIEDTINDTLDIMDWALFTNAPLLILTVDLRKAYDSVDRQFLLQCLAHLGVPETFIHWVRLMHSGTSTCISVNNNEGPVFPVNTGVRQGCPLAPLLFICMIENFHRYTSLYLPGFALSPTQRRLMACYADDITLFLNSNAELDISLGLLAQFATVSGEYPNWEKCSIIPFNVPSSHITASGQIPIRLPHEAERILGIFVELGSPGLTTWTTTLSRV